MRKNEITKKAIRKTVIVVIISAIPVYILTFIIGLVLFFKAGGTFGGYGASASDNVASWHTQAVVADYIFGLLLLFIIGRTTYRSYIRKHSAKV